MEVLLANPRGFCAGVERAIKIVERALERFGAPIYVRHEIVHNRFVVDGLRAKGAVFVDELADVPAGGTVIFSAHGVSLAVQREAAERGLKVFDATCPLVTKVHVEVGKMRAAFGKVNSLHNHVLPWADRPLVIGNLLGGEDGPRHPLHGRGQYQLDTIPLQQRTPLHAHVLGHRQD